VAGVILSEVPIFRPTPSPPGVPPEPEVPLPPTCTTPEDPLDPPMVNGNVVDVIAVVVVAICCVVLTVVSFRFCLESDIITAVGLSLATSWFIKVETF